MGRVGEWQSGVSRGKFLLVQCPMSNAQCPMSNAQCPMTPDASSRQSRRQMLLRCGDASRTSRETRPTHCLPNALAPQCPMPDDFLSNDQTRS
jgi:hypothetical protein